MNILVINAGSSSLKYQLMDPETKVILAKGLCERIGIDGRLTHKVPATDGKYEFEIPMPRPSRLCWTRCCPLSTASSSPWVRSTLWATVWSMVVRLLPTP